ncbi:MAG: PorT family protein [Bacteroidales bacterium]|nr:PorT family protein [Bacteroidales bacterium]
MLLKIKISIIVLLFFLAKPAFSQPLVGFQMGLNLAKLVGDEQNEETRARLGLAPYLSFDFPINNILIIETGISYSMQGMQRTRIEKTPTSVFTTDTKYQLDYVVVPVYVMENFEDFYAKIGPYGAYAVSAVEKWEMSENTAGVITNTSGTNLEFPGQINLYDIGLSFGFGYIHYFDNRRHRRTRYRRRRTTPVLQIDLKYNLGLITLDKTGNNSDLNFKNRVFTFGLTFNSILD